MSKSIRPERSEKSIFIYPNIKCPYCKFHTTAPESLGIHLIDKHGNLVIKGYIKIKPRQAKRKRRAKEK